MTAYTAKIASFLNAADGIDPRHVEAYMRVGHSILSSLSPLQFVSEVRLAVDCIKEGGADMAERIAQSFGL